MRDTMTHAFSETRHLEVEDHNNVKALFCWVFVSVLVLWIGPFTNYAPAGFLDPWIYTGYFTNFTDLVTRFGMPYYVSRLPYVLFGRAVYAVFTPWVANFLIN